ncbi:hypothetical protein PAPHI01_0831 [Pancytospora philotis]|nr:hypothetical protein PAPHI01_0831 [Pancytospora philotis]
MEISDKIRNMLHFFLLVHNLMGSPTLVACDDSCDSACSAIYGGRLVLQSPMQLEVVNRNEWIVEIERCVSTPVEASLAIIERAAPHAPGRDPAEGPCQITEVHGEEFLDRYAMPVRHAVRVRHGRYYTACLTTADNQILVGRTYLYKGKDRLVAVESKRIGMVDDFYFLYECCKLYRLRIGLAAVLAAAAIVGMAQYFDKRPCS